MVEPRNAPNCINTRPYMSKTICIFQGEIIKFTCCYNNKMQSTSESKSLYFVSYRNDHDLFLILQYSSSTPTIYPPKLSCKYTQKYTRNDCGSVMLAGCWDLAYMRMGSHEIRPFNCKWLACDVSLQCACIFPPSRCPRALHVSWCVTVWQQRQQRNEILGIILIGKEKNSESLVKPRLNRLRKWKCVYGLFMLKALCQVLRTFAFTRQIV